MTHALEKTYLGKPCRRGHEGLRYKSNSGCVDCQADNQKRYRAKRAPPPSAQEPSSV